MDQKQKTEKISAHAGYCVSLLSGLYKTGTGIHTDTTLYSDGITVSVHSAILSNCSAMMADLLASTGSTRIILHGFSTILSDFASLVYTGKALSLTEQDMELLTSLCKEIGMDAVIHDDIFEDDDHNTEKEIFHRQFFLQVESDLSNETSSEKFSLRLPLSRVDHITTHKVICHDSFEGFKGRVQKEYNESPVGPYEGPYDQDSRVPLYAQLPKSRLNFDQYTNFIHQEEMQCKVFRIKPMSENIDDLKKIESLEVCGESSEGFVRPENDEKVFYTCSKKSCVIPCPCHTCSFDDRQCLKHNIKHVDLFNESEHLFSVRTTELSCSSEQFFSRSYVLKYPGIPKTCSRCRKDLLHHKSYHLDFHWRCKFCKFYQYKLYPKTIKELHEREVKEKKWYKSVCPHCNKKFVDPYQRRKHIECEHNKNYKLKCDECQKPFQCEQSLQYHKLSKHTENVSLPHSCNICNKSFQAKVSLDNHLKYKHSDTRKFVCTKCDSKFKQRKNLNAHMRTVHSTNPSKEDYWQDIPKETFKCETCGTIFTRKSSLQQHVKVKHEVQNLFECDHCKNKFRYKKNLEQHILEKHGSKVIKFECPDCGNLFNQKRNMERHQLTHKKK